MHVSPMANAAVIVAERLSKVYRVKVRDPGLGGALRPLGRLHYCPQVRSSNDEVHVAHDHSVASRLGDGRSIRNLKPPKGFQLTVRVRRRYRSI